MHSPRNYTLHAASRAEFTFLSGESLSMATTSVGRTHSVTAIFVPGTLPVNLAKLIICNAATTLRKAATATIVQSYTIVQPKSYPRKALTPVEWDGQIQTHRFCRTKSWQRLLDSMLDVEIRVCH